MVSTEETTAAAEAARNVVADLELTIPRGRRGGGRAARHQRDTISSWITFGPVGDEDYAVQLDRGAAAAAVGEMTEAVNQDAVSATFGVAGAGAAP